ncbi:unnamed protein product, partial [Ectocarpus sp. 6 AP-2014]
WVKWQSGTAAEVGSAARGVAGSGGAGGPANRPTKRLRDALCVVRVHCAPRTFPASQVTGWSKWIVHKNEDVVVVDKPAGVSTVPTIDNGVQNCVFQASLAVAGISPGSRSLPPPLHAVSRLDVCTSGVVVFARHKDATKRLNELFRARRVKKRYLALLTPGPPVSTGSMVRWRRAWGLVRGLRRKNWRRRREEERDEWRRTEAPFPMPKQPRRQEQHRKKGTMCPTSALIGDDRRGALSVRCCLQL